MITSFELNKIILKGITDETSEYTFDIWYTYINPTQHYKFVRYMDATTYYSNQNFNWRLINLIK
jgi:hypothetical protein